MASGIKNLGSFKTALGDTQAAIDGTVSLVTRKIALTALVNVVLSSPVDTGRFRGNWQIGVGHVPTGELPNLDKGGGATISAGSVEIDKVKAKPYVVVTLVNNLPYAEVLNGGSSKQAPAGFVETAIDAASKLS